MHFPVSTWVNRLTGGTLPLLEVLGVRDEIENAGFLAAPRATVLWAGRLRLGETHGGYQVNRGIFDALLLNAARRTGVEVRQPASIIQSVAGNSRWTLTLRTGETIRALFLGDASGRSRFLPGPRTRVGATSLALYAYWSEMDAQDGNTIVEAAASHWFWAAPLPGGLFNATIIVDPSANCLDSYLDFIWKSRLLGGRLAHGRCGKVSACSTDLAMKFYQCRLNFFSKFHAASAQTLYREQFAITATDFWRKRAGKALAREATAEKNPLQPEQYIRLAEGVSFVPVPTVDEHHVVVTEGVERNGKTNVFVAGVSIAALLKQIDRRMLARELLRRWKCILPAES